MNAWYVVHTHAKSEQVAVDNLARQGFRAYLPRYLKSRKHARRVDTGRAVPQAFDLHEHAVGHHAARNIGQVGGV